MREINDFEKEIIKKIIDYHNKKKRITLIDIIYPLLEDKSIYVNASQHTGKIKFDKALFKEETFPIWHEELISHIVVILKLLRDLQEINYVILYFDAIVEKEFHFGNLTVGNISIEVPIYDPTVISLLEDYSHKKIHALQPLIDFERNGFKTDEKVRADKDHQTNKRNLYIALIALGISAFFSILGTYFSCQEVKYGKMQVEQNQNIRLNEKQQKAIEDKLNENKKILEQIQDVLLEIKKIETLKTQTQKLKESVNKK